MKKPKVKKLPRKVPWGFTAYGPHRITILKSSINPQYDGLTWDRKMGLVIEINTEVFEQPSLLDETLIHEFIHVIENVHALDWVHQTDRGGGSCCPAVNTLGHGLAQMLRELQQV